MIYFLHRLRFEHVVKERERERERKKTMINVHLASRHIAIATVLKSKQIFVLLRLLPPIIDHQVSAMVKKYCTNDSKKMSSTFNGPIRLIITTSL